MDERLPTYKRQYWGVLKVEDPPLIDFKPAGDYGLRFLDVSNPISPTATSFYTTTTPIADLTIRDHEVDTGLDISGEHMALRDNYAYLAGQGLHILDVSDPGSPVIVGATQLGLFGARWSISGIAVDDAYAYLLDDDVGLCVHRHLRPQRTA